MTQDYQQYRRRLIDERDLVEKLILENKDKWNLESIRLAQGQLNGINLAIAILPDS